MPSQISRRKAKIRVVEPQDISAVREVILEMLADSPFAFGETLAEAQARTDQDWSDFVAHLLTAHVRTAFIADDEDGICGFVYADADFPQAQPW